MAGGENYEGSSARGAMKGWHKHGVCSEALWPYKVSSSKDDDLTATRSADARRRLLGAYFRVNHLDLVAMHSAICEVGVLYATGQVHSGWDKVGTDGIIPQRDKIEGGHAFAIVGYDADGLWIQNSWGKDWGRRGFGRISYDDWLTNASDVWVARLAVPIVSKKGASTAVLSAATSDNPAAYTHEELRPHIISTGNDGELREQGMFGTSRKVSGKFSIITFRRSQADGKENASCSSRTAVSLTSNRPFSASQSCANLCSKNKFIPSPSSGRLITGQRCRIFCVTHFRVAPPVASSIPRRISCSIARMICSSRLRER